MKKILMLVITCGLIFGGYSILNQSSDNCVNLYIDYGPLDNGTKTIKCIKASSNTVALDILKRANLKIEGTKKYGLGVVCRVNGLPDQTMESCETMPPAKAYWAIIIKEKQKLPFPINEWGWGQLAIDKQLVSPGDSIGLVWANNGKVIFP